MLLRERLLVAVALAGLCWVGCSGSGSAEETGDAAPGTDTSVSEEDTGASGPSDGGDTAGGGMGGDGGERDTDSFEGWADAAPIASGPRQEHDVVVLNSKLYVIGGFDRGPTMLARVDVYDPAEDSWSEAAAFPERLHHANAAVVDGAIYVAGYLVSGFQHKGKVYKYDPSADEWTEKTSMLEGRARGASAVAVIGGKIYVAGGLRGGNAVKMTSVYDPENDSWTELPDAPRSVDHSAAGAIDGKLVMAGGRDTRIDGITDSVDIFDPEAEAWSEGAAMPTARGGVASTVVDGHLLVLGGEGNPDDQSGVFPQVEAYELSSDSWKMLPEMRIPRHGMEAGAVDGVLHVPGGGETRRFGAVDAHTRLELTGRL